MFTQYFVLQTVDWQLVQYIELVQNLFYSRYYSVSTVRTDLPSVNSLEMI